MPNWSTLKYLLISPTFYIALTGFACLPIIARNSRKAARLMASGLALLVVANIYTLLFAETVSHLILAGFRSSVLLSPLLCFAQTLPTAVALIFVIASCFTDRQTHPTMYNR